MLLGVAVGLLIGLLCGVPAGRRWRQHDSGWNGLSTRRLLGWIDAASSGWLMLDRANRVVHLNPRAKRLLQIDTSRLWHGVPLDQMCNEPELVDAVLLARRQDRPLRLSWASPEGELELLVIPADGGWLALLLNSRRTLEAQLAQQERWVSDVAHELKTPLTALLLVGDSLAARVADSNAVLVSRLQRELRRLQDLVADLLELSRLENTVPEARLQVPLPWFDAPALVQQVWQGLRPLAEPRQVRLELQVLEPHLRIQGDSARVHRALLNLLDNALRYCPDGGCIQVGLHQRGRWCVLAVRDQGPGLSPEDQEHLFERFYRGDPARVRGQRTGSGLGLSIVQQIAMSLGGRVRASNHPDGGAVLELILPALPRVPPESPALSR